MYCLESVTIPAFATDQQAIVSAEEEEKVNELAWEVVERILYDLSIEEKQLSEDQASCMETNIRPVSPHTNNPESGIGSPNQEEEESSDESHTMIDETCSVTSSSTLPILIRDETISNECMISGDLYSHQQAEEVLEEAVQQLSLNEQNNCLVASLENSDADCEELAAATKNLALEDSGCNVDDVGTSPRPLVCDDLSALTDNMQIISISHPEDAQGTSASDSECESHQLESCNMDDGRNAGDCIDHVTEQLSDSMVVTMRCELTPHLLDTVEGTESKISEQYFSTESRFISNNSLCIDNEPCIGSSDYDSAINADAACAAIDNVKGDIGGSDVYLGSVSDAHLPSNSKLAENLDNEQEDIQGEGDQQDSAPCHESIESHDMRTAVPELFITPVDACCHVKDPDKLSEDKPDECQKAIIHSNLQNFDVNICVTSHCNQSIGLCCLPPLQIDIGEMDFIFVLSCRVSCINRPLVCWYRNVATV